MNSAAGLGGCWDPFWFRQGLSGAHERDRARPRRSRDSALFDPLSTRERQPLTRKALHEQYRERDTQRCCSKEPREGSHRLQAVSSQAGATRSQGNGLPGQNTTEGGRSTTALHSGLRASVLLSPGTEHSGQSGTHGAQGSWHQVEAPCCLRRIPLVRSNAVARTQMGGSAGLATRTQTASHSMVGRDMWCTHKYTTVEIPQSSGP